MNIFIVCSCLTGGGAERVGAMLATGFARHGHDVSIITDIYQEITYNVDNHVNILPLHIKTQNKYKKWFSSLSLIRQYAKNNRPDLIIGIMHTCSAFQKLHVLVWTYPSF